MFFFKCHLQCTMTIKVLNFECQHNTRSPVEAKGKCSFVEWPLEGMQLQHIISWASDESFPLCVCVCAYSAWQLLISLQWKYMKRYKLQGFFFLRQAAACARLHTIKLLRCIKHKSAATDANTSTPALFRSKLKDLCLQNNYSFLL